MEKQNKRVNVGYSVIKREHREIDVLINKKR